MVVTEVITIKKLSSPNKSKLINKKQQLISYKAKMILKDLFDIKEICLFAFLRSDERIDTALLIQYKATTSSHLA